MAEWAQDPNAKSALAPIPRGVSERDELATDLVGQRSRQLQRIPLAAAE
jgi:hypothetical protein